MLIRLLAVGQKMPKWITEGFDDYAKRIKGDIKLKLVELPMQKRGKTTSTDQLIEKEADTILDALTPRDKVIALDVLGKPLSTEKLAASISNWQQEGVSIALIIGGPDGLSKRVLDRADLTWSLSGLTLPHPLVRVVLVEQIYRAWSINQGHPYHR